MTLRTVLTHIVLLCFWILISFPIKAQQPTDGKGSQVENNSTTVQKSSLTASQASILGQRQPCQNGMADDYPCLDIDLHSFVSLSGIASGIPVFIRNTNDIWGWTDPDTGVEYALVGTSNGTAFYDLRDPSNPEKIAFLVSETDQSLWRDIKVYNNHAFIVADNAGNHGMQVFDLTQLRSVGEPPVIVQETALYTSFGGGAHNVVINEESGYAYVVGARFAGETCGGGLHMVNIQDPTNPVFEGCFSDDVHSYTHDAQCVTYRGPDEDYRGREICLGSNEFLLSIADVTDKSNPIKIVSVNYPNVAYTHQGWLSEDHRYFYMDDELDELNMFVSQTRTLIWDLEDLDDPVIASEYLASTTTSDHNQYVRGDYLFQSNYESGVRILDISSPEAPVEVAFFDVLPHSEEVGFIGGTWSNYPYFESGIVIASSMNDGFFVLEPTSITFPVSNETPQQTRIADASVYPNPFIEQGHLSVTFERTEHIEIDVYDLVGRKVRALYSGTAQAGAKQEIIFDRKGLPAGLYHIRMIGETFKEVVPVSIAGK